MGKFQRYKMSWNPYANEGRVQIFLWEVFDIIVSYSSYLYFSKTYFIKKYGHLNL